MRKLNTINYKDLKGKISKEGSNYVIELTALGEHILKAEIVSFVFLKLEQMQKGILFYE